MKSFVLLLILVALPAALSIKCYVCADCGGSNGKETTCGFGFDKCGKFKGKQDGKEVTARNCANAVFCAALKATCETAKKAGAECEYGCCDSDLCNSGVAPSFNVLLVSLCSLFAVVPFFK